MDAVTAAADCIKQGFPRQTNSVRLPCMKRLTATLCLTIALLFGCTGVCKSADFQKGLTEYDAGRYSAAYREWKPLAEDGSAPAQYYLGVMYLDGIGVKKNSKNAVKWIKLAAAKGDARAQSILGVLYSEGESVPKNYKIAVKWTRLSAEQGYATAQNNLGFMYEKGRGARQNYKAAEKLYSLAAKQGFTRAQTNLKYLQKKIYGQTPLRKNQTPLRKNKGTLPISSKKSPFDEAREKCTLIGFKQGTEKYGECVLKLIQWINYRQ